MKIPDKVKVGGFVYKVLKDYRFKEDVRLAGQQDPETLELRLSSTGASGHPRVAEMIEESFWHELLHTIDLIYNNAALDEKTIARLSMGLFQVMQDNFNKGILLGGTTCGKTDEKK